MKYVQDYSGIPAKLREMRLDAGLTIRDIAEMMGVHGSTVSQWEQGVNGMSVNALTDYCRCIGATVYVEFRNELVDMSRK